MRRSSLFVGFIGALIFANIGAHVPAQDRHTQLQNTITITGCLTGGPEAQTYFVTAESQKLALGLALRTEGVVPTYTYQLVPPRDVNLQQFLGKTVEVQGHLDPDVDEELSLEREEEAEVDPPSDQRRPTPKVEVEQEAQIEIRQLNVVHIRTVEPNCVEPPE